MTDNNCLQALKNKIRSGFDILSHGVSNQSQLQKEIKGGEK